MSEVTGKARLGRRGFLAGLGIAVGSATAWNVGLATPAAAGPAARTTRWTKTTSANGWPVQPGPGRADDVRSHRVQGSNASVAILSGEVAAVLLHVARRFHYEIGTLHAGHILGHTTDRAVVGDFESNYLSGTAIAIRPDLYPAGANGCLFPHEVAIVRDIIAECDGVVRWGGDDRKAPKEGHFQIDVKPGDARLTKVARKFDGWAATPGKGAGAPVDPFAKPRRQAAEDLAARQQATA